MLLTKLRSAIRLFVAELAKPGYDKAEETVSVEVINPTTGSVKCVVAGEITGENIRFSKRDKPFSWRNS